MTVPPPPSNRLTAPARFATFSPIAIMEPAMRILLATALLLGTAPALAQTPAPAAARPARGSPDEVVCKREVNTGSLIQGKRTCMTRAQWQAQAEAAQASAQRQEELGRINSEAPR